MNQNFILVHFIQQHTISGQVNSDKAAACSTNDNNNNTVMFWIRAVVLSLDRLRRSDIRWSRSICHRQSTPVLSTWLSSVINTFGSYQPAAIDSTGEFKRWTPQPIQHRPRLPSYLTVKMRLDVTRGIYTEVTLLQCAMFLRCLSIMKRRWRRECCQSCGMRICLQLVGDEFRRCGEVMARGVDARGRCIVVGVAWTGRLLEGRRLALCFAWLGDGRRMREARGRRERDIEIRELLKKSELQLEHEGAVPHYWSVAEHLPWCVALL